MRENSAILLTAPGVSAIAVVRLCGPGVSEFLKRHFTVAPRHLNAVHGRLVDGDREIDDPVVILDESRSLADICTHGGSWVVHSVLELAERDGFERVRSDLPLADAAVDGEDELEREILQYLPMARTKEAIQTLLSQREAWGDLPKTEIGNRKSEILSDRSLHYLLHPPRVAIIGAPNSGKSTLANALFRQDRSIVADLPGTTRDYVEDFANLGGLPVRLVDTPGLRENADELEAAAVALSVDQIASADLGILLLDPTQPRPPQETLASRYPDAMRVSGKSDVCTPWEGLPVSAVTRQGMAELEIAIRRHFGCETLPHDRPCVWTGRQRRLLESR